MNKEEIAKQKTILNVGYCETTSEWLSRIITELADENKNFVDLSVICLLYTSPSPRDRQKSRMPSSA